MCILIDLYALRSKLISIVFLCAFERFAIIWPNPSLLVGLSHCSRMNLICEFGLVISGCFNATLSKYIFLGVF